MAHVAAERANARAVRLELPKPIRRALGRLDRRLRTQAAFRGLGTSALVAAVVAAVAMALDFFVGLSNSARWGVWLAGVFAAMVPLTLGLIRGIGRRARALDLAAVLERSDPELGERLTGTVGLLGEPHGSPDLIAALADDASAHAATIDAAHAAPAGKTWRRLGLGVVSLAVVAAPALIRPDPFERLTRRVLMPWMSVERIGIYDVVVAPGDTVAALGDDLAVSAWVAPRFAGSPVLGGAWLEWSEDATARSRRIAMTEKEEEKGKSKGARGFALVLPRLAGSLTYRVVSGSGESRRYRVKAIAPPALSSISARVEPPSYTKLPASEPRDPARFEAWEDSRVTLTLKTTSPIRSAEVAWPQPLVDGSTKKPEPKLVAATVAADGLSAKVVVSAEASGEYTIGLRDAYGLASRPEPPRRIVVRPDEPPVVAVGGVEGLDEARADDTLRVGVAARDDVAVASAELHYSIERAAVRGSASEPNPKDETGQVAAKLPGLGTRKARGEVALGLKKLNLRPGDVVSYRARVTDNRPAPRGPNVAWSGARRLTIVEKAESLLARRDRVSREQIQAKLDALKKAAAENRHETELLRYAADAVQRGNGEWDRERRQGLARREAEARAVAEDLEKLAHDLADAPAFRPLARPARQIAEVEAEAARATLDQARQADDDRKRLAELRQADSRLAAVSNRLEELQRGLNVLAEREADRQRLQALADRQGQVADKANANADAEAAPDRARLDQVAAEQNAVKKDLDELLRKSPELRADVLAAQADEAEALARRARTVAEHQRAEARTATDLSRKTKELKALAEEQRAIEVDARRLALDVDTPLSENGRGRLNTEVLHQAVEPIERGDLDQGRQQLVGGENDLRRIARDLEDAPGDLKALARRLAQRQERLAQDVHETLGEARGKTEFPAEQRAEAGKALKALAERQQGIAALTKALVDAKDENPAAKFPRDAAEKAVAASTHAAEAVKNAANPREMAERAGKARDALQRLANELPDPWKRQEPTQRALNEARRIADQAAHDAERHVRETEQHIERDPARAAGDLAKRLAPVAEKARQAAERLEKIDPIPRVAPQRDRAARRALALADAIEAARKQAESPHRDRDRDRAQRDAVNAAATRALAATERFEQKLHGQIPADDIAAELAAEQRALASGNGKGKPDPEAAGEQRRLATALRTLPAPDAPLEQAEAVRQAERAARDGNPETARLAAEAADALADALAERRSPRARIEALARAEHGLNDPANPVDPAVESARQRAIAAELTRLDANDHDNANTNAASAVRQAGELAEHALHPDQKPDVPRPTAAQQAAARTRAARELEAIASRLSKDQEKDKEAKTNQKPAPNDPELMLDPEQGRRAQELARRERRLRERLQAVLGEQVEPQQNVRRESVAVGHDLADLRDRTAAVSDRARGPAHEAAGTLGQHAPRAMDEAANQLAQGQPTPARNAQRQAAEVAERGAQQAEDFAAALRADLAAARAMANANGNANQPAEADANADALAEAREAMGQAARRLGEARGPEADPAAMAAARQAMRGAAERLQAAAGARSPGQAQAEGEGETGESVARSTSTTPSTGEPNADRAGVAEAATLTELQDLIRTRTGRRWGELPGHLRSEILQMSQGRYRDDYARLIQLYFREIAAGAEARP